MPQDVSELICFGETTNSENGHRVCFSKYQRELSTLYMIASPVIKTVYGTRLANEPRNAERDTYLEVVQEATKKLWSWRQSLPPHLQRDLSQDCPLFTLTNSKSQSSEDEARMFPNGQSSFNENLASVQRGNLLVTHT